MYIVKSKCKKIQYFIQGGQFSTDATYYMELLTTKSTLKIACFYGNPGYLCRDTGGWRGTADVIAVGFYLLGIVPLLGISLLEVGVISRKSDEAGKLKLHATFVGIFLVVVHIAMIFGMLNPKLLEMGM